MSHETTDICQSQFLRENSFQDRRKAPYSHNATLVFAASGTRSGVC